ncbi:ABC transporter substrate-binding protein [Actinoalloteichus hymeniacidonis]|uniref:ABC-type Fe3+-hydroxamate transport system, periplasmic component n=1 Tax=Actinoalloteichus hymeniacidonis TaxID=340345 RepID=A0AAC9HSI8_9PSEU|nr:iron-siderophore ABC transporter substrate-binding protein [Actinoalloteichus hymeniacidonis]AOS64570.1 ABC-type Fe3+-hydroxamate transport system, periplasmic component [Actinoalloteichus hymeniacidonis]MBB5907358.1 iron complex transport system substrate-binding protein [Actinoalloteichus hymeniacidonis]
MRSTRVMIGLSAAAAMVVAGCGTTEEAGGDQPAAGGGDPITIVDSRGQEVTLDGPAQRVAATEWNGVEHLVSLDVMPVGVADIEGYSKWVSAVPLDDTPTEIGTRGEPSIDTLGSLNLDLVVATDSLNEGAIEQIEAMVPVIVIEGGNGEDPIGSMFASLDMVAEATGKQDEAEQLRTDFDAKIAEGAATVEELGATGEPIAFSDAYADAGSVSIRPFVEGALVVSVFEELGLENAWTMEGDASHGLAQADVEGLTELGDVRFWYIANDVLGDPYTDELAGNAIWQSLPFVQDDKVYRFPDGLWMFGGPLSMMQYVDAAVDALEA